MHTMRKITSLLLCLTLALCAAAACAETETDIFAALEGYEWSFSSGVGGWSTDLRILPDGSFSGEYHDSEMGDSAEAYPDGTVYSCSFTGTMKLVEQADENSWVIRVENLQRDEGQEPEAIEGGIRYILADTYGLSEGDEMRLWKPGTPLSAIPEGLRFWTHAEEIESPAEALTDWFLSSEKNESGFVGFKAETVGMANPWLNMTAEELQAASGVAFGAWEGAENICWRYLPSENLAEMQFTWESSDFCARVQPVELAPGEMMNISGIYYAWEDEEPVRVNGCDGTIATAKTGSVDWVELCQWYDAAAGRMCSLSVASTDIDGLDLVAIAEEIF